MGDPVSESKQLAKRLTKIEDENKSGIALKSGTAGYTQPAVYFKRDHRDDYYETKAAATASARDPSTGATPPVGNKVEITDEDIRYLQDQKTKEELVTFDQWFQDTYMMGADPNKLALGREMYPAFFERREANIRQQVDICRKLAKLGLRGPRTEPELEILYALKTGRLELPDLDLLFPSLATQKLTALREDKKRAVVRGYWNPRNYTIEQTVHTDPLNDSKNFGFRATTATATQPKIASRAGLFKLSGGA
jgi:hypothetical protein